MTASSRNSPQDDNAPLLEEILPDSDRLYFIFGGIRNRMDGMLPFEFFASSRILDYSKIFFRDCSQSWYQCGLRGIANDIHELEVFIKEKIFALRPHKVYFVGNSMGGFAAILFASMIGTGKAIAFAPQTCLSLTRRLAMGDNRWNSKIFRMYTKTLLSRHIYDLQNVLRDNSGDFAIDIHVSASACLDMKHALALQQFRQVKIHSYNFGGHNLVRHLRDNNTLAAIIAE